MFYNIYDRKIYISWEYKQYKWFRSDIWISQKQKPSTLPANVPMETNKHIMVLYNNLGHNRYINIFCDISRIYYCLWCHFKAIVLTLVTFQGHILDFGVISWLFCLLWWHFMDILLTLVSFQGYFVDFGDFSRIYYWLWCHFKAILLTMVTFQGYFVDFGDI